MTKQNKRFARRIDSRFPPQILVNYLGQESVGRGVVQELSRVGCRILGNYPVVAGETLSVRIALPSSRPLIINRVTVKWVKGLEFGLAFSHLDPREADRLQHLLEALLESGSDSRHAGSRDGKPPAA